MIKNYILFILFLLLKTALFAQKVTLTPTVVNSVNVSVGPVNLGSVPYSNILLTVKVEIPANVVVGNQGTIKIYFSKGTGLGNNVAIGGDGGALYFGGDKIAYRSFNINLNWGDFSTSGGYIYAEYKNNTSHISSNLTVIKNTTVNSGTVLNPPNDAPNPNSIANTLCCNQTIRLGDKPAPINGSQYLNPYQLQPYGINSQWNISKGGIIELDNINKTLLLDYTTELGNIIVNRKLGYNHNNQFSNKSNDITITVVPSPILSNQILVDIPKNLDGYSEVSSVKGIQLESLASRVNLNILEDPYHINQRGDNLVNIDSVRWEYTKINKDNPNLKNWITIPNSEINNFTPSQINSEDNYYLVRSIAIYKNITRVSNEIKIMTRGIRHENTICCDQTLKISSETEIENPSIITGSTPIFQDTNIQGDYLNYTTSYQWQSKIIDNENGWTNISGATSKDYLPSQTLKIIRSRRSTTNSFILESNYAYRRITKFNYQSLINEKWIYGNESCYSNETTLRSWSNNNEYGLKIYPNPTSSILNIDSPESLVNAKIYIFNPLGIIVNSNDYSLINPNLITINTANLTIGTYFITIDYNYFTVQKIFTKN